MALGIEKAGFDTIGLIEFDKAASDTLKCNRPEWRVINDDIANISCLDLEEYFGIEKGELDLLSGGAPCQSFSYAGKRLGLEDARGTLFYHYAKFLDQLQPKMFLFENVRGLLTHDRGRTYKTITDIAKEYMKSCWYMEGGRTGILRRLSLDEPSLTVLTSPSQKQTDRCHPLEPHPFTIRENARCQSFPDDWQFCGSIGQQYKQVGNAVPVNLAYDIALKIKEALEEL